MKDLIDESARSESVDESADGQRRALLKKASMLVGVVSLSSLAAMIEASAKQQKGCFIHCNTKAADERSAKTRKPGTKQ